MLGDYNKFKEDVYELIKIDLNAYQESQMHRRIDSLISENKIISYDTYFKLLQRDKEKLEQFINFLTINVSEFYRDKEQWEFLKNKVIPELIQRFGRNLKIWSAACSTGDEPYSLVMELSRHILLNQIKIIATDIDRQVLETARRGIYSLKSIEGVPSEFRKKYFTKIGKSYRISEMIKSRVEFQTHNLLEDEYPQECHMIVCRNVLIYFTEEAKTDVYRKFNEALVNDGVLFIGSSEQILKHKELNFRRNSTFFFSKERNQA